MIGKKKYYLFVGIDRVCKYAYVELHERMTIENACTFLENMLEDMTFKVHTILTDNGSQFTYALLAEHFKPKNKEHPFDALCKKYRIEHRLTKVKHPWTNGQVERFNRTLKENTTKIYYYKSAQQLKHHIMAWLMVYNYQRPLKALGYKPPYDAVKKCYDQKSELFTTNPYQKIVGLKQLVTIMQK